MSEPTPGRHTPPRPLADAVNAVALFLYARQDTPVMHETLLAVARRAGQPEGLASQAVDWLCGKGLAERREYTEAEYNSGLIQGLVDELNGLVRDIEVYDGWNNLVVGTAELRPWIEAPDEEPAPYYVTMSQAAGLLSIHPKTLGNHINAKGSTCPRPDKEGGGGKAHEWRWSVLRPWLEEEFGRILPRRFPGSFPS